MKKAKKALKQKTFPIALNAIWKANSNQIKKDGRETKKKKR